MFPCIQTVQRIPLNTMTLEVHSPRVYTSQGVPISVIGTAQVKINGSKTEMLEYAAEQFGGKPPHEILRQSDSVEILQEILPPLCHKETAKGKKRP